MPRRIDKSATAFRQAQQVLVGGVNSPVRSFASVGGQPPIIASGRGSHVTDLDGNEYIDYVGSYGPCILGHASEPVVSAVADQLGRGFSFGAPCQAETLLAENIVAAVGSAEKVRFVSSGTEAAMTAVRLARGATGRTKIIKYVGGYHGHADALLVSAGSGAATLAVPSSPGVPPGAVGDTLLVAYNDLPATQAAFDSASGDVAAVLVEPVAGNMGVVPPAEGFLSGLRRLCEANGSILIFDEVMTGFRIAYGGAQALYGVRPDLTVLGKIIGGGLPVGAVAGPAAIMDHLAPIGSVYQAGTLSGNPLAMTAGLATLQGLRRDGFYDRLEETSAALEQGLRQAAATVGLAERICLNRVGSMLCCFFAPMVGDYAAANAANAEAFAAWFHAMLEAGIYLPPSRFEAFFVSAAHSPADVDTTVAAATSAFAKATKLM